MSIKPPDKSIDSVLASLVITLHFHKYRYFISNNNVLLFEIRSDCFVEYDMWEDFGEFINSDFFESYKLQLESGEIVEVYEAEWLLMKIK